MASNLAAPTLAAIRLAGLVLALVPLALRAQSETVSIEPLGRQKLEGSVVALSFSARGDSVAVATSNGRVRLLDAKGAGPGRELLASAGRLSVMARSRDDARIAVGTERGEVQVTDVAGSAKSAAKLSDAVTAIGFSPSGNVVAAGLKNGEVVLLAAATGDLVGRLRGAHRKAVVRLAYLRDGETLVSVGADRDIVYWDVKRLAQLRAVKEAEPVIMSASFTPSGDLLFVGTEDVQPPAFGNGMPVYKNIFRVYDMAGAAPQKELDLQGQSPAAMAAGPDCRVVAVALRDRRGSSVALVDVERGVRLYDAPTAGRAQTLAFAPDGRTIAVGTEDGTVHFLAVRGVQPRPRCSADLRGIKFAITGPREPLVRPSRRVNVAIMGIADNGVGRDVANGIADLLLTRLARNPGVRLVERRRLDLVLRELDLKASGRVDAATAVQAGRLFSAHKAITGGAARLGTTVTITVQLVDLASGAVDGTREVQCNACEDEDLTRAISELAETLVAEPAPGAMAWPDPPYVRLELPRDGADVATATMVVRGDVEYARALKSVEILVNGVLQPALKLLDPPTGKALALGDSVRSVGFALEVALVEGLNVIVVRATGTDGNDALRIVSVHRTSAATKPGAAPSQRGRQGVRPAQAETHGQAPTGRLSSPASPENPGEAVCIQGVVAGGHGPNDAIASSPFLPITGTRASSAGKPTTSSRNARSLAGRPRIPLRNPIGLGVWVSVARPAWWSAVMSIPVAIPTDSCA